MVRVAESWGILLLTVCTILVMVHLALSLAKARMRRERTRFGALAGLFAALTILALWLTLTDHSHSMLIITGALLPLGAVLYAPVQLVWAMYRKRHIRESFLYLLAASVVTALGITASWMLAQPAPFVQAAQPIEMGLPLASGWSSTQLQAAFEQADKLGSHGVVVIHRGRVVVAWGDTSKVTDSHSVRKSILSVLIGIATQKGLMDLDLTLAQLGIDDKNPKLTGSERQATVEQLLTSRSGIYHRYVGDRDSEPPAPGSHPPGTFFYYNNWDFNVLGAIFERRTGYTIGRAMREWLAEPIGMQDFHEEHVVYERFPYPNASYYPAYKIWISTRDLARFGLLLARNGQWEGEQVVPRDWIKRSTSAYSSSGTFGYGYSWWRSLGYPQWLSDTMYLASGTAGQKLLVDSPHQLVVVHRTDTQKGLVRAFYMLFGPRVNNEQFLSLTRLILKACPTQTGDCPEV